MRIKNIHIALLVALSLVATGCSCRTRAVGDDNIDAAAAGKELKDVFFAFDSYALDATAKETLAKNADWLKAHILGRLLSPWRKPGRPTYNDGPYKSAKSPDNAIR